MAKSGFEGVVARVVGAEFSSLPESESLYGLHGAT